jgi:HEAT repeat protein
MRQRNSPAWKTLLKLLQTGSDVDRVEAAKALGFMRCRSRGALDVLAALLSRYDSPSVSELAAYVLGLIGNRRYVGALAACLCDKRQHDAVRGQAAEALGQIKFLSGSTGRRVKRVAESALLEALSDPSATVRFWCCFALGSLRSERAIALLTYLSNHDAEVAPGWLRVREEAADALEMIAGTYGKDRIPVHLRHEDAT